MTVSQSDQPERLTLERRGDIARPASDRLGQQGFESAELHVLLPTLQRAQTDTGGSGDVDHFCIPRQKDLHPDEPFGNLVLQIVRVEELAVDLDEALATVVIEAASTIDDPGGLGESGGIDQILLNFWHTRPYITLL